MSNEQIAPNALSTQAARKHAGAYHPREYRRGLSAPALTLLTATSIAAAISTGCAGEHGSDDIDEPIAPTLAILGGAEGAAFPSTSFDDYPPSGAVQLRIAGAGSCSGVMVGTSMVLTAAHCLTGGPTSGYIDAKIELALPDPPGSPRSKRAWACLTGSPGDNDRGGICAEHRSISFERYSSADAPRTEDDLMVLFPGDFGSAWSGGVADLSTRTVWTGALGHNGTTDRQMALFGRGPGTSSGQDLGIMRYATFWQPHATPDAGAFAFNAPSNVRTCGGDSGGPYLDITTTLLQDVGQGDLIGIHSGSVHGDDTVCAKAGGQVVVTKLTSAKMNWINEMRAYNGYAGCSNNAYRWECP